MISAMDFRSIGLHYHGCVRFILADTDVISNNGLDIAYTVSIQYALHNS